MGQAMEPYTYDGLGGDTLAIHGADDGEALQLDVAQLASTASVVIRASDLPGIVARMYAACGWERPIVLDRIVMDPVAGVQHGPFRAGITRERHVTLAYQGNSTGFTPDWARGFAKVLAAMADAAEAQPDPEDVEALARLIESGRDAAKAHEHGGITVYVDSLARFLLASGRVTVTAAGEDGGRG